MRKFNFRLQPYLKVCAHREDAEQLRLQELLQELQLLVAAREALSKERAEIVREFRDQRVLPVYEAEWYVRRIDFLEEQVGEAHRRVLDMEAKVAAQRERLIAARRRRKVVEKLRERRHQQYELEAAKALQNDMDDLFLLRRPGETAAETGQDS